MWRLKIILKDGKEIVSPIIVPNNPRHSYDSITVLKSIGTEGSSMVKRLPEVKKWEFER